jgi:indole-3-glycerol phosphate synthase
MLEGSQLGELLAVTRDLGMDALIEVFDETDLERALDVGATLIGINHRDLETFEVDPDRTAKLAPLLPPDVTLVSLSGVSTRAEVESLVTAGAKAVLVGTSLVIANDPAAKLKELRGA